MTRWLLMLGLPAALLLVGCPTTDRTTVTATDRLPATHDPGSLLTIEETPVASAPPEGATGADLIGYLAPDFTLTDYHGVTHTLSDYTADGKIVVLEWFEQACGAVRRYYSHDDFRAQLYAGLSRDDVVWLSVNSSGEGTAGYGAEPNLEYAAEIAKTNPVLEDAAGTVGRSYGATVSPTVIVIAADGRVSYFGTFDQATTPPEAPTGEVLAIAAVESLAAGRPVAVPAREPFG